MKTPMTSTLGRLLPASQAADLLGITDGKIRRLIARGEITVMRSPSGRLGGIYEADARAWLDRSRTVTIAHAQPAHEVDALVDALIGPNDRVF